MATHSSLLAWKSPWTEQTGGPGVSWGHSESDRTERLSTHTCTQSFNMAPIFQKQMVCLSQQYAFRAPTSVLPLQKKLFSVLNDSKICRNVHVFLFCYFFYKLVLTFLFLLIVWNFIIKIKMLTRSVSDNKFYRQLRE